MSPPLPRAFFDAYEPKIRAALACYKNAPTIEVLSERLSIAPSDCAQALELMRRAGTVVCTNRLWWLRGRHIEPAARAPREPTPEQAKFLARQTRLF